MKTFLRLRCLIFGHELIPTGRHGIALREWECGRCGRILISHPDHAGWLIDADDDSDKIMREGRKYDPL